MDNEVYRDLGHHEAADILAELLREHGNEVRREYKLPSGVIADLLVVKPDKMVEIIEVKTVLKASLLQSAQRKYGHWCNRLSVGVPHLTKQQCEPGNDLQCWRPPYSLVGIVGIYRDAYIVFRPPYHQAMNAKLHNLVVNGPLPS